MSLYASKHIKQIHLIGIGGAGMGGIAEILLRQGYSITGSDIGENTMTAHLGHLGATIYPFHSAHHIEGAEVVVVSTAIPAENPELAAARQGNIPILSRAQLLADLMRQVPHSIAVAGTHGKTTTTSLMASVLMAAGVEPTFVIGGLLKQMGTHAYLGNGKFFVAEADESDASLLHLNPELVIVTNIDADHMEIYQHDLACLRNTFVTFLERLPFHGLGVLCLDDPNIQAILPSLSRPVLTYGFHPEADLQIIHVTPIGFQNHFTLRFKQEKEVIPLVLNLPGHHNVLNATAVCGLALHMGIELSFIQDAFRNFMGVNRRLQVYGECLTAQGASFLLIDDYGHHPQEIKVTWAAIRQAWPDRRLIVVYQPHRYSRTRDLFEDFVEVLSHSVEQLILLEIYGAGEASLPDVSGEKLSKAIAQQSKVHPIFVREIHEVPHVLDELIQTGDIVLVQGAGSIGTLAPVLEKGFKGIQTAR